MATHADSLTGLRVLVVEDEALIAEELGDRLSRMGMTVLATADSAELAVASALSLRPDIVLMDIRIKGARDGIHAARDIQQRLDVPILYLTAHSDRPTLERALATAPFGYLLKPFQERELFVALEMAIHRHALEQRLRESEQRYVSTLASIADAVVSTDDHGCVTFMNPVAEALTGWVLADARGSTADAIVRLAPDQAGHVPPHPVAGALRDRHVVADAEQALVSKAGQVIPIECRAAPMLDGHGGIVGAVLAFRDMRERRVAAAELRRMQEDLLQSRKMESVGRLAGGIAHDFNNLLTVVNGCADLALDSPHLDEGTRQLLGEVANAGTRAAQLTRQLVAFGRKQVLQNRTIDLAALVADLAEMLRRLIGDQVTLVTTRHAGEVFVHADPSQLERVVVNLALNARDAMPGGGVLTIATGRATIGPGTSAALAVPDGLYVTLAVTDTGSGMADEVKERLFEPYFTTKAVGRGTGLGLATTYGIVTQSDGVISVDSSPGRGTTFTIYLPLLDPGPAPRPPTAAPGPPAREAAAVPVGAHDHETILLVEDDAAVRSLLASLLRRHGYTVIETSDGASALAALKQTSGAIDLVVSDVVMPGMRNPALVRRLTSPALRARVLYMSGYASDALALAPNVAFIQKPFAPSELAHKVRQLLDH